MPNPLPYVGQNIWQQRHSQELPSEYVAQKVGISVSMLDSIEQGDVPVDAAYLPRFAVALGCTVNALLESPHPYDNIWDSGYSLEQRFSANFSLASKLRGMKEEWGEVLDAIKNERPGDIAAEMADLMVTLANVARACGIDRAMMHEAMRLVVKKNNAKTPATHELTAWKIARKPVVSKE